MEILVLKQDEIRLLIDMSDIIAAVREVFKSKIAGEVLMPSKSYLQFEKYNGDLRVMPSYIVEDDIASVKIVNAHPENPKKYNLPTVMALITIIDPKTGAPLSIMDGTYITAVRTGAAAAVATEFLSRKDSKILGIVGAGRQAETQLSAINEIIDLSEVRVYDIIPAKKKQFISTVAKKFNLNFVDCENIMDCVVESDIISTITPVRNPIVMNDWIAEGVHINAMGADGPGKEELDPLILKRGKIVVDDWEQATLGGEINVPLKKGIISRKDIYAEIGDIVSGRKKGRESKSEITIFDSTGLAIQDNVVSNIVYRTAKGRNIGRWITF